MARKLVKETKKARLLRLLEERDGVVDLGEAARVIYGTRNKIAQESLERALGAYRMKDRRFAGIRVRNRRLVCLKSDAAPYQPPPI
ncbi:hypothetical protein [Neomoorella mulderi]|uniref:Uncharacterized protein n=1 Tax=Moorella mulderi DSM 14980 TaxID=1122241 RepID=A0A151B064_9FIRM|nr:hypothetical protein [Moorella mulderi]KYH33309.1 hypothetical protein MOMUL_00100 [Moorella mulderi DSM 14980]